MDIEKLTVNACSEFKDVMRRDFLKSLGRAGIAGVLSAPAWMPRLSFAADDSSTRDLIVRIFLFGGLDGLAACPPYDEAAYYAARPTEAIPRPDDVASVKAIDLDGFFGLHPALSPLKAIYDAGDMAIVHATGHPDVNHSHFYARDIFESGASLMTGGWLGRHLANTSELGSVEVRAISAANDVPRCLHGGPKTVAIPSVDDYGLGGDAYTASLRSSILANAYSGILPAVKTGATSGLATADVMEFVRSLGYSPANGAMYPNTEVSIALKTIANIAKADVGVEVAAMTANGWDTHESQGSLSGDLYTKLSQLGAALAAFYTDMGSLMARTTIIIHSEFGRRVAQNNQPSNAGTDHGYGGVMFVIGGGVNGGQVITDWPGLDEANLVDGNLDITIDSRDILAEILQKRAGNSNLAAVFPGFTPTFRNVVQLAT
ncbi:MAG: DUF1501 domain-containing protein [Phycisphaerales bacterium]|nr:DUF1501 domain-containing protein [Phycisphaerales bacterium]MCB9854175.1 DUF1501 domain-containing protein [Phycisphaerales bacterium]MCB9864689.1 DUF1501 domain-containing protein [Phycisphaerales bacterium]